MEAFTEMKRVTGRESISQSLALVSPPHAPFAVENAGERTTMITTEEAYEAKHSAKMELLRSMQDPWCMGTANGILRVQPVATCVSRRN